MKTREARQLPTDMLRTTAEDLRAQIVKLRYHHAQRKEKNVKKLRTLRHDLARILTLLTEREKTPSSSRPA